MLHDKMEIISDLWSASIKADFINAPNPTPEMLMKACKKLGISWFVILREHTSKGQFGTVRIRDVSKRQEIDVLRSELVEMLIKMISDTESEASHHLHTPADHHPASTPLNQTGLVKVHIFSGPFTKIKPVQKSQISERALKEFAPVFAILAPTKQIEIVAHELSSPLVRCLVEVVSESEEVFRKAMENFPGERDVASKFRAHLRTLKDRSDVIVPLYNYRDNVLDIVPLLK